MILPPFELHQPTTVDDAIELATQLRKDGVAFDWMAGGTDVLPNYKNRLNARDHVIALGRVDELTSIGKNSIGALARIEDVARNARVQSDWPTIAKAASLISSPPLRNLGTVGGNLLLDTRCYYFNQSEFWRDSKGYCLKADGDVCLVVPQKETCYATYSGDLAPILLVLDVELEFRGPNGARRVPLRSFFEYDGIKRFEKSPDELLVRVFVPSTDDALRTDYLKLRARDTIEYPVMGVAMGLRTKGGKVADLRVAVTGSEAVPLYYGDLGLGGAAVDEATADAVQAALLDKITCYRNVPFPPGYRKAMGGEFGRKLFLDLSGKA
ncbi:MAG: FAD binding domain-containing protein [Planctomycetes bacterium]|nr:FAD binding domain-containing protein [Planctomycetota bacterium]